MVYWRGGGTPIIRSLVQKLIKSCGLSGKVVGYTKLQLGELIKTGFFAGQFCRSSFLERLILLKVTNLGCTLFFHMCN